MKDGFYLSVYLYFDKLSNIIDFTHRHDQNISLWYKESSKIKLVHYWELERVTGYKQHHVPFRDIGDCKKVINHLLKQYNLSIKDIIEIWGTPGLDSCDDYHSLQDYPYLPFHSIAHLFSAILLDTNKFYNDTIIGLTLDGGPDRMIDHDRIFENDFVGCVVNKGNIKIFPIDSPGKFWFHTSNHYKMREGSLMALGSASKSMLLNIDIEDLFNNTEKYYEAAKNYLDNIKLKIDKLDIKSEGILFNEIDKRFTFEENKISMYVKVLQKVSIKMIEKILEKIFDEYNITPKQSHIALVGGYALNCPTNSHLMHKYKFKSFIAPPCVNDSGMSLGIALYGFYKKMNKIDFVMQHAYYGDKDDNLNILNSNEYSMFIKNLNPLNEEQFIKDIMHCPIVWFNGSAEIGPRALGHRSILADPRSEKSKEYINTLKQREWWRPIAPIVLEENVNEWFENAYTSPFMLHTFKVKKEKLEFIPAITHLDNTARVQTLTEEDDALLYKIIKIFKNFTKIPLLANSSLNDKGEPIINTIEETLNFALRKKINIIYINGCRVELTNHNQYHLTEPLKRQINVKNYNNNERKLLLESLNPHKLPAEYLRVYCRLPLLKSQYDLRNKQEAKNFSMLAQTILDNQWRANGRSVHNNYLKSYYKYNQT